MGRRRIIRQERHPQESRQYPIFEYAITAEDVAKERERVLALEFPEGKVAKHIIRPRIPLSDEEREERAEQSVRRLVSKYARG